jgi:hypothetical protein
LNDLAEHGQEWQHRGMKKPKHITDSGRLSAQGETPIRHIRMADELWDALTRIGAEVDRTPGYLTRLAVEEFIERHRAAKRAAKAAENA